MADRVNVDLPAICVLVHNQSVLVLVPQLPVMYVLEIFFSKINNIFTNLLPCLLRRFIIYIYTSSVRQTHALRPIRIPAGPMEHANVIQPQNAREKDHTA